MAIFDAVFKERRQRAVEQQRDADQREAERQQHADQLVQAQERERLLQDHIQEQDRALFRKDESARENNALFQEQNEQYDLQHRELLRLQDQIRALRQEFDAGHAALRANEQRLYSVASAACCTHTTAPECDIDDPEFDSESDIDGDDDLEYPQNDGAAHRREPESESDFEGSQPDVDNASRSNTLRTRAAQYRPYDDIIHEMLFGESEPEPSSSESSKRSRASFESSDSDATASSTSSSSSYWRGLAYTGSSM